MWFPKFTGRLMDERLGRWNFWTMFVGINLAFLPMHLTGLWGMPRRVYTYPAGLGWDTLNLITTIGSFVFAAGVLLFAWNVVKSRRSGALAGPNPWDAYTLEWSVPSPPPPYNFDVIPTIVSRHPLWEDRLDESAVRSNLGEGLILDQGKETLATTPLDAEPERILEMPEDTIVPFLLALAMTIFFIGMLLRLWLVAALGGIVCAACLLVWLWPDAKLHQREPADG
jgi:heme/copper-type cytochrome/quinol oxidase subunit 1